MGLRDYAKYLNPTYRPEERADPSLSMGDWLNMLTSFSFNGINYTLPGAKQEDPSTAGFTSMTRGAFKGNGIVAALIWNRMDLFSEVLFTFQRQRADGPSGLFGTPDLRILEKPWPGGTTGDLLSRMLLYHDIAGNAYVVRRGSRLTCLRPDWVTLVGGVPGNSDASVWHPDAEVLGYVYKEGGPGSGKEPIVLMPNQVAHFAARPDPETRFTGMSWITPVVREVMGDKAASEHKLKFFENGATPNLAVKLDVNDLEVFKAWIKEFKDSHEGVSNAYKTMFLAAGADVTPIGTDLQQLEFKVTQGAGETRIAAAAGVPPVVAGFSEGLAAATYSNYAQARRRFADQTIRPLWRNACGSLQNVVNTPKDARLWYDVKDVSALQEDRIDAADIMQRNSTAIKTFVDAGYTPESAAKAVSADDLSLLVHTGLVSVQLQVPGSTQPDGGDGNGSQTDGENTPPQGASE
jgi:HK97 family phage portal protein